MIAGSPFARLTLLAGIAITSLASLSLGERISPLPLYPQHDRHVPCEEVPDYFKVRGYSIHTVNLPMSSYVGDTTIFKVSKDLLGYNKDYPDLEFVVQIQDVRSVTPPLLPHRNINASITAMGPMAKRKKWMFRLQGTPEKPFMNDYFLDWYRSCTRSEDWQFGEVPNEIKSVIFQEYWE